MRQKSLEGLKNYSECVHLVLVYSDMFFLKIIEMY
jgi:hypothetical protein